MELLRNTFNLILIIAFLNNVNSYVIRYVEQVDPETDSINVVKVIEDLEDPSLEDSVRCVMDNNCENDINCIARCYNVPSPDKESVLRTADCQITCNAKYPDPYTDTDLLNQCYEKCVVDEYYYPYKKRMEEESMATDSLIKDDNADTTENKGNSTIDKPNNATNQTANVQSGFEDQAFYSLLVSELVLVFTVLYLALWE